MRADYGESMRLFFGTKTNPKLVVDFGMAQIFESATTYTNIMLLSKALPQSQIEICRMNDDYRADTSLSNYIDDKKITIENPKSQSWIAYVKEQFPLITKIIKQGKPLKEWNININRGILTGDNDVFIIEDIVREEIISTDPKSSKLIQPIL